MRIVRALVVVAFLAGCGGGGSGGNGGDGPATAGAGIVRVTAHVFGLA